MTKPQIIDIHMHGEGGITAAFIVQGERTALVETGPKSSVDSVLQGLDKAGVDALDFIVVTHIHLDHAGAAGTLTRRFPSASVVVHPAGAPHLVDPSRLWSSAGRIYGDDMDRLWGGIDPVDPDRIRVLEDGESLDLGGRTLRAVETPGHARHHHAFLDGNTGILFTGDALGVRLQELGRFRPATPPPEFNLEQAVASIERIREVGAKELWLTHYGPHTTGARPLSVDEACTEAIEALITWSDWVRKARAQTGELDEATALVRAEAEGNAGVELDQEEIRRLELTTSYRMNTWGYLRYFYKREQKEAGRSKE